MKVVTGVTTSWGCTTRCRTRSRGNLGHLRISFGSPSGNSDEFYKHKYIHTYTQSKSMNTPVGTTGVLKIRKSNFKDY